jgi:hypothetical protein
MSKLDDAAKAYREAMKAVDKIPAPPQDKRERGDWNAFAESVAGHADRAQIGLNKVAREEPEK